jgi:hypothetical protein
MLAGHFGGDFNFWSYWLSGMRTDPAASRIMPRFRPAAQ